MPYKACAVGAFSVLFAAVVFIASCGASEGFWDFPDAPPPAEYGNILINRTSEANGVKPVAFSHWSHRIKYTCRVCHFELEFNMKANTTEISEAISKSGRFCGACHDGKEVFGHDEANCAKCHNGNRGYGKEKFQKLLGFPRAKFGNNINWTRALRKGMIKPVNYLLVKPLQVEYDKTLTLEAEWARIPPSIFPHKAHTLWLDCNNCHPDIFNIKKKTTKHFEMVYNLSGEFCGVCHLNVAFPMNDCKRCHPDIRE